MLGGAVIRPRQFWPTEDLLAAARAGEIDLVSHIRRHLEVVRLVAHDDWEQLRAMGSDWGDTLPLYARAHHVVQFLLGRIVAEGREDVVPQRWIDGLRKVTERRRNRVARLEAALPEIAGAFVKNGIGFRVLKGAPFSEKYFGGPGLRDSLDLDLLVREEDAHDAVRTLIDLGYRAKRRRLRRSARGPEIRPQRLRTEHALELKRRAVSVDLHWRLRTAPAYRIVGSDVWSGPQQVRVGGIGYPVLSDEYALVLLLISLAHDVGRRGARLKHVLDVYQLLRCLPDDFDWTEFFERRQAENTLSVAVNVLLLVRAVFGEEDDVPGLTAALNDYRSLQRPSSTLHATQLIHGVAGGWLNTRWLLSVYPVEWLRDALWFVDRHVVHPGSLLVLPYRGLLFTGRAVGRRAKRYFTRGPSPLRGTNR